MTTDIQGFPIDEIIANVAQELGDQSFRYMSYGWYLARGRDALSELGIDSKYFTKPFDELLPQHLAIQIPKGVIDIKELYGWNGSCFVHESSKNIYFKSGFTRRQFIDESEFQKNKPLFTDSSSDDFIYPTVNYKTDRYYAGLQDNHIVFSDSCSDFTYVRIVAKIIPYAPGEDYAVPEIFRKAIELFILEKATKSLKLRDPLKYRPIWRDYYEELYGNPFTSVWQKAILRAKRLDSKKRRDITYRNI